MVDHPGAGAVRGPYRPWQATGVALAAFAANAAAMRGGGAAPARSRLAPPDALVVVAWPVLKAAACYADLVIANAPDSPQRRPLLARRAADWLAFATFGLVGPRSGKPSLVLASTAAQAGLTVAAVLRARRVDRRAAAALLPQAAWLAFATAAPLAVLRENCTSSSLVATPERRRRQAPWWR